MNKTKIFTFALAALLSLNASAEVLTNQTVLSMLQKGYGTEIIIGQIENADECQLTCSLDDLDALTGAGADAQLITYLQGKVKRDNGLTNGLYWYNTGGKPQKLQASAIDKETKSVSGGLMGGALALGGTVLGVATGSSLTAGTSLLAGTIISGTDFKSETLIVPGLTSSVKVNNAPVFRVIIPEDIAMAENAAVTATHQMMGGITSPNDLILVKLNVKGKGKKAKRTMPSGLKWSATSFSTSGSGAKNVITFDSKQINNRTWEVSLPENLEPGEYAFFYKNLSAVSTVMKTLSVFDFTVE